MRIILCLLLSLACLVFKPVPSYSGIDTPPAAPANIVAPSDETLALVLTARGVQIYECRQTASDPVKYEWVFKAPEADLFDAQCSKVGRHLAGPTWVLTDGGMVVGRVKSKADAPDGKGIPWLLLDAVQASGAIMGKVQSIQRVDTVGGKAPAYSPDATQVGKETRVEYTATYKFYVGSGAGGSSH